MDPNLIEEGVSEILGLNNVVSSTNPTYVRAPDKPVADPAILSILNGTSLTDIGNIIGSHIVRWDDKPQVDSKNPNRLLMRVFLDNPHAPAFQKTSLYDRIEDPVIKEMTVEQLINAQFARLTYIAKEMENDEGGVGHRAEFIKWPVPTPTGQVLLRSWAYNAEGYIVCEHRGYTNIRVAKTIVGPARVAFDKNAVKDTGGYDPTMQVGVTAKVVPAVAVQSALKPAQPVNKAGIKAGL